MTLRSCISPHLQAQTEYLLSTTKAHQIAQFEERTTRQIHSRRIVEKAQKLAQTRHENLQHRRDRLAHLYSSEEKQWRNAIRSSQTISFETRVENLRSKALALKSRRETANHAYVTSCYERQWRDSCDELRSLDSRAVSDNLMNDRKDAVRSREMRMTEQREEDARRAAESRARMMALRETERREREETKRKNKEVKAALDEQVTIVGRSREMEVERKRCEEWEEIERWKEEERVEKERQLRSLREAHERGQSILKSNLQRHQMREQHRQLERQQDLLLLEYAIQKEREEIASENAKRCKEKDEARGFISFLKDSSTQDAKENSYANQMMQAANEKMHQKAEQRLQAEINARTRLMEEVENTRAEQMRDKLVLQEREKQELLQQTERDQKEWERQDHAEQLAKERRKQQIADTVQTNKRLMAQNQQFKLRQKQDMFLMKKEIEFAEQQHKNKLAQERGKVKTYYPLRHTNWYS